VPIGPMPGGPAFDTVAAVPVRVVHLVAKTHLDLGFTALAAEVEQQYLDDFFPRAAAVAAELRARGGSERLVWTTGSWILRRALDQPDPARAAAVDAAVRAGDLAWHALPVTTHTELMDAALFRAGLGISQDLDERFGRTTTAAKMTDVPGHTRAMVPHLAGAGVTFLHLGVNPAWPVPDVPEVFRWRAPTSSGGSEVVVAYATGGYGGELVVPGCDAALAFLHSGDNLGPPSVDDVLAAHADLRARHPGADVRASTLDAFARALASSGAVDDLPVVTSEIGDPWIFGAGSDPQKVSRFRHLLAERRIRSAWAADRPEVAPPSGAAGRALDEALLLVAEHTWGLDQKVALPEDRTWGNADLPAVRASAAGRRFEASWAEQRRLIADASAQLWWGDRGPAERPDQIDDWPEAEAHDVRARVDAWSALAGQAGVREVAFGEPVQLVDWTITVDGVTGGVSGLRHGPSGRDLADADRQLGVLAHQSFDEADYERFYAGLQATAEDEWWARWDNTKPGIDACGARSAWSPATPVRALRVDTPDVLGPSVLVELAFASEAVALGAPPTAWIRWTDCIDVAAVEAEVVWADKPATRLPEATWCSFVPLVAEPERWEVDKLDQRISPLDVVRRGGRALHGVESGMFHDGPDGRLRLATWDAPLVAPGRPDLLDADPPVPDLAGGWHVLLHDNCWGTNFPMWNEGPARFGFFLSID